MFLNVRSIFKTTMEDWEMMSKTYDDEGAHWAERFEHHFYLFIEELKKWFNTLENRPQTVEEAEELPEIKELIEEIPGPLQLNFLTELEEIVDQTETQRFD
ncbi:hypothetical protein PY093_03340 [Cytobacillus sp. S13-E01]|uniref:hypothetical protein n=1 Tax=Cytobacillus sp. S13-E01 TaxID=3031326 RepID=UPI0023D7F2CC|nr:hypothetical protein [Cytobacillus sp. S13-E01]MDF0725747.1 hypothetical protein [Cytobacillus sp. S13-E01]